jgi:Tol biopolymer transport system component
VVVRGSGSGKDANGFTATIASMSQTVAYGAATTFASLSPGEHTIVLDSIAPQCAATADSATHVVRAGVTDTVTFDVSCVGGIAYGVDTGINETQIDYLDANGITTRLTSGPYIKAQTAWSPDGTRLLYTAFATTGDEHYVVRADGTGLVRLPNGITPRWSPDGTKIVMAVWDLSVAPGPWIRVTDADGSNPFYPAGQDAEDFEPIWSSDGSRLFFMCNRFDPATDLCALTLDGTSTPEPIHFDALASLPRTCSPGGLCPGSLPHSWTPSPDGRSITFVVYDPVRQLYELWVGAIDGSSAKPLAPGSGAFDAQWSPSGNRIAVSAWDGGTQIGIATVNPDGSDFLLLTDFAKNDGDPSWSPDAAFIAFDEAADGVSQIWVMKSDGTGRRKITEDAYWKSAPRWRPNGSALSLSRSPNPPSMPLRAR